MKQYKEIYNYVKLRLSEERFFHSECVANRCVELAKQYNTDIEIARLVGIAHDIAKEMPEDEKLKYCIENNLPIDDIEKENPGLLHGRIGADIVKKEFKFSTNLCSAIECHTTGKENMSLLDKILYVADMTSEDRPFPDKDYMIQLANSNLDECVKYILKVEITKRMQDDKKIHLNSVKALNFLIIEN